MSKQINNKEINTIILIIIESMSESLRCVFLLRYYEQLSIKELAEVLGISENAVKIRINRARNYIKEELEKQDITLEIYMNAIQPGNILTILSTLQSGYTLGSSIQATILTNVVAGSVLTTGGVTLSTYYQPLAKDKVSIVR